MAYHHHHPSSISSSIPLLLLFLSILIDQPIWLVRSQSTPWSPTTTLVVSTTNISADCTVRPSPTINFTSPGPVLRYKEGQRVWIRVINQLDDEPLTIHFHGLAQFGSPFADGTSRVSQPPIPPRGGFFDYEFQLPYDSAGTYLYHSHQGLQSLTAYGAFIVEENDRAKAPYRWDHELTLLFADYYHAPDRQLVSGLEAKPLKFLGEPQSLVVNGRALGTCDPVHSPFGCSQTCRTHVLDVKPGSVYRIRLIGISVLSFIYFAIESHAELRIIEVDGAYVKPAKTSYIQLASGQRYSILLKTKSLKQLAKLKGQLDFYGRMETRWREKELKGAFLLRYHLDPPQIKTLFDQDPQGDRKLKQKAQGALSSSKDLSSHPIDPNLNLDRLIPLPDERDKWLTSIFRPLKVKKEAPTASQVTRRIFISGQQKKLGDGGVNWFVNNVVYVDTKPQVPVLVTAYSKGIRPNYEKAFRNNGYDPDLNAYPIKLGEVIEFVIINRASTANVSEAHPWHFHGNRFWVIGAGYGEFTMKDYRRINKDNNRRNKRSIERDTQVIFAGKHGHYSQAKVPAATPVGWLVLRLVAKTPGAFLIHCHLQVHAVMGMTMLMLTGIEHLPPLPRKFLKEYTSPNGVKLKVPMSYFDSLQRLDAATTTP